ncbi:integrase [Erwinia toletana]|uniref:Integrase n=1 Tax=Winslowiella toletana TaxID=92490 RepID=A0ABS4PF35_9GAMM|nr:integrase arm-type DNA-binding domain-containing protein [Winslowiella toletana]MBP2170696.1 integrase [Winslowiella toletana]
MPLTDFKARKAAPREKPYKLGDSHGLYLIIYPTGSKHWYLKFRYQGKENRISFGAYPTVTLSDARELQTKARAMLAQGINPSENRKEEKRGGAALLTFSSVALEWAASNRSWSEEHTRRVERYFELYVFPVIGSRDIRELKLRDLLKPVKTVELAGKIDVATRLQQRIAGVMRYAAQNGLIDSNPALDLRGAVATAKTRHHPALPLERLPELLSRIDHYKGRVLTRLAVQLNLLLFVRSSELRFARWNEINLKKALWTIPATREPIEGAKFSGRGAKMRTPHLVPLSRQAILLFRQILSINVPDLDLVFPSEHNCNKTISEGTTNKALRIMGYNSKTEICGHGFRTMACSALVESGLWSRDAVERQMSHQERSGVRAAYIHKAEHMDERQKMMQWWADYLDANRVGWVSPYDFGKVR